MIDEPAVIVTTRRWISNIVIGLNLCPFAERVFVGDRIRYVVTLVSGDVELREVLSAELQSLAATPLDTVETTLLIHPHALVSFPDYNDFLTDADDLIRKLRLRGVIQIASFHPEYQFGDTAADAPENFTNRSPYPMLHLLREESITRVAGDSDELAEIPRRNVELLRKLGTAAILNRLQTNKDAPPRLS